jgi:hypothetical protein
MALTTFTNGTIADADEVNSNFNTTLRQTGQVEIAQLQDRAVTTSADGGQFVEAYVDADGQNASVSTTTSLSTFNTDRREVPGIIVTIEATSISAVADFAINDCVIQLASAGVWQLVCTAGDAETQRAQIYKTLFYGTNGSNPRASATYITSITALTTNISRDVGKQAHYADMASSDATATYLGTFANTSTNTDCSTWSYLTSNNASGDCFWEVPNATVLNSVTASGTSDETGTDLSADELDNPATCELSFARAGAFTGTNRAIVLCVGDVTWSATGTSTNSNIDFFTDNSIPLFTSNTATIANSIEHTIPTGTFSTTLASAFVTFKSETWESGADVNFKLTNATEDTGWLNTNEIVEFTALTAKPDSLIIKLIPKSSSPTSGYPSINGVALYADRPA